MYKVTVKINGNSYVSWCSTLEKVSEIEKKYKDVAKVTIEVWS